MKFLIFASAEEISRGDCFPSRSDKAEIVNLKGLLPDLPADPLEYDVVTVSQRDSDLIIDLQES